jgi:ABC-2 type transport system ATP-binding protein
MDDHAAMVVHERAAREARARADGPAAIVCSGLTKDYGQNHGIFDLDLRIDRGETFGFIGPNGAGKTTTIRLLMDLIRPTCGHAAVLGMDTVQDSVAVKRRVGYLPGELAGFPGVTAGYVIGLLAGLRGGVDPDRIGALADRFRIDLGRKYETLSHGNKQKVGLIQAFMHEPELLILDEPTNGPGPGTPGWSSARCYARSGPPRSSASGTGCSPGRARRR